MTNGEAHANFVEKLMVDQPKPHIPKNELVHGAYYRGECRNAQIARWDAHEQCFYHWRYKFGGTFLETIKCPEDDAHYDVFYAQERENFKPIPLPDEEA